jgi:GTPase SAR1 family protein
MSDINILILGSTGVGKSTFINGLVNYFNYSSFEQARQNGLIVAIPSQFTESNIREDGSYETRKISIGNDENESTKVGESSTQFPKVHVFKLRNKCLRLIDTPGIGDTRGIEYDKQNMENILSSLSYYTHLNAICILLKPNDSRLDLVFRFCIKELLTHLHKSAKDNIVFCFTNSRSTNYRPAETYPILERLLSDMERDQKVRVPLAKNVFCFDNESFRFLACLLNGIRFSEDEQKSFLDSWNHSVKTTKNMMSFIMKLPHHNVTDTLSMNDARRMVIELAKPVAEITQNIQNNIKAAEDRKRDVERNYASIEELNKNLYVKQKQLNPIELEHPQNVCTSSTCSKSIRQKNGEVATEYKVCHKKCKRKVVLNKTGEEDVKNCKKMEDGKCTECGCSWKNHMLVTYRNESVEVEVIDENVQKEIAEKTSANEKVAIFKNQCEQLIKELNNEQKILVNYMAKFASFLKKNAISPYNDELLKYLDHLIREEEGKKSAGANNQDVIKRLFEMKSKYEEEKRAFLEAKTDDTLNIDSAEVKKSINELFKLKHNGNQLEKIIKKVRQTNKKMVELNEMQHEIRDYTGFNQNFNL